MEFLDARRITGPNLLWNEPGAILDVRCDERESIAFQQCWSALLQRVLPAVGWAEGKTCTRSLHSGISLAFSAPIDGLYAAAEINEWVWQQCASQASLTDVEFDATMAKFAAAIASEANPALLDLAEAAREHGVPFLWDDDEVSVGLGKYSASWPVTAIPAVQDIDWSKLAVIPTALVTGTNGKTTTVRLATHIARQAGHNVGLSSTDWIAVNDSIIDHGDYSGPGGARSVLRQKNVDLAILETARGGLLRRGLGLGVANAALITNVSEDHLGDFGSQNLSELTDLKWIVSRAVEPAGVLILNADDPLLVARASNYDGVICWFSLDANNKQVARHCAEGGVAFVLQDAELLLRKGHEQQLICQSAAIPITLGGIAKHNVANALGAAALCYYLGMSLEEIAGGLCSMSQDQNPGRSNVYSINGFKVLADFAHNPDGMKAVFNMAVGLSASRKLLVFSQAGDRTDSQIHELARCAWEIQPQRIIISELSKYARGRKPGEVYELISAELKRCGAQEKEIFHYDTETESLDAALAWAQPGDLIIMLALGSIQEITARLKQLSSQ